MKSRYNIYSGLGILVIDHNGEVLENHAEREQGISDPKRFDMEELKKFLDSRNYQDILDRVEGFDIVDVGFWAEDGEYIAPEENHRNKNYPMRLRVLHITPSTNGYEEVWLLANRVDRSNSLAVIQYDSLKINYTGGYILDIKVKTVLDKIDEEDQYEFIKVLRTTPFVKDYARPLIYANAVCWECGTTYSELENGYCEHGHDAWVEVEDKKLHPEWWKSAKKRFKMDDETLERYIENNQSIAIL